MRLNGRKLDDLTELERTMFNASLRGAINDIADQIEASRAATTHAKTTRSEILHEIAYHAAIYREMLEEQLTPPLNAQFQETHAGRLR